VASQLKVNEIIKQSGSSITIGESGDTASGIFTNTPAFSAKMSAAQSISNDTSTKIAYDTEIVDTDSAYDNSTNYRFTVPSNEAGRYFIGASVRSGNVTDTKKITMFFHINGSEVAQHFFSTASSNGGEQYTVAVHDVLDLSVGDYIEVFVLHQSGGSVSFSSSSSIGSFFHGFKLIGA
tara:strand:- start:41 stop:577 length:537 start_codon:yes stop_codon:yes gene_type:complete